MPTRKEILVLNGPSYGHILPILMLSRKLSVTHSITFAVSRHKAAQLPKDLLDGLTVFPIQDDLQDDLGGSGTMEDGFNTLNRIIVPAIERLTSEIESKQNEPQIRLSTGQTLPRPEVVIFDMFLAGPVMRHRLPGVRYYLFNSSPGTQLRWFLQVSEATKVVPLEEHEYFHKLPAAGHPLAGQMAALKELFLPISQYLPQVDGVLYNSFREIEKDDLQLVKEDPRMAHVPAYCVGPLIPPAAKGEESETEQWLRGQAPRSVVYVAFGTIGLNTPGPEQLKEIGKALLQLNSPALWALPTVHHTHLPAAALTSPLLRILPWVPQKSILAASATALFLSHVGWNSVLEALSSGVPIVAFPMSSDQLEIARTLSKKGLGRCIEGTGIRYERIVPAAEIVDVINEVGEFDQPAPGQYHAAAEKMREEIRLALAEGGSSCVEYEEFVRSFQ